MATLISGKALIAAGMARDGRAGQGISPVKNSYCLSSIAYRPALAPRPRGRDHSLHG